MCSRLPEKRLCHPNSGILHDKGRVLVIRNLHGIIFPLVPKHHFHWWHKAEKCNNKELESHRTDIVSAAFAYRLNIIIDFDWKLNKNKKAQYVLNCIYRELQSLVFNFRRKIRKNPTNTLNKSVLSISHRFLDITVQIWKISPLWMLPYAQNVIENNVWNSCTKFIRQCNIKTH